MDVILLAAILQPHCRYYCYHWRDQQGPNLVPFSLLCNPTQLSLAGTCIFAVLQQTVQVGVVPASYYTGAVKETCELAYLSSLGLTENGKKKTSVESITSSATAVTTPPPPTPAPAPAPASAPSSSVTTIKQSVLVQNLQAGDYTGAVKQTSELAYLSSLGLTEKGKKKAFAWISSSFGSGIDFVVTVTDSQAASAAVSAAQSLTASSFASSVNAATSTLGTSSQMSSVSFYFTANYLTVGQATVSTGTTPSPPARRSQGAALAFVVTMTNGPSVVAAAQSAAQSLTASSYASSVNAATSTLGTSSQMSPVAPYFTASHLSIKSPTTSITSPFVAHNQSCTPSCKTGGCLYVLH